MHFIKVRDKLRKIEMNFNFKLAKAKYQLKLLVLLKKNIFL